MLFRVRSTEGCETPDNLFWDSVWINQAHGFGGYGDWILANANDPRDQRGGLRSRMQLMTAIMLCLFVDRRLPEGMTPPGDPRDRRGWWGNSIRLDGEPDGAEMGSLLWTLERNTLSIETRLKAIDFAREALQTLIDQEAVASFVIDAEVHVTRGMLGLAVTAYDTDGRVMVDPRFDIAWQQQRSPAPMNYLAR